MQWCCMGEPASTVEGWDLPEEPGHSRVSAMVELDSPRTGPCSESSPTEELEQFQVGEVAVPGDEPQGLELLYAEQSDRVVIAGVIEGGPWAAWNDSHPDRMCKPGDLVLSVNGCKESVWNDLTTQTSKTRVVTLMLQRPKENRVKLIKVPCDSMGLVCVKPSGLLFIRQIRTNGIIHQWNLSNPTRKVRPLDQMIAVNGVTEPVDHMVKSLSASGTFELVLKTHSG
mmetsp:Transcript_99053/g.308665  ORF Transcript_99053/g.308665 Transcript_99053/m.308665 type:complete len:227 (+) Transcript_99053:99-779(+)